MLEGTIVKQISNTYSVLCQGTIFECFPRGLFRKQKIVPLIGDTCLIDPKNNYLLEIKPRKNELIRPAVANVDIGLIVVSMVQPNFDATLLDKQITSILLSHVSPVLCFTKLDLMNSQEKENYKKIRAYYEAIGIPTYDNLHLKKLWKDLKGMFVVLTGQSGAGKSTLMNRMDPSLQLQTEEISQSLNRGKHTTRHSEIFFVHDVSFCDTPGFSSLTFTNYTEEEIRSTFIEFQEYDCPFRDCRHLKEPVCGVKKAIEDGLILKSRYESYQKIIKECQK